MNYFLNMTSIQFQFELWKSGTLSDFCLKKPETKNFSFEFSETICFYGLTV